VALVAIGLFVLYAVWLIDRLDVSRATIEARARSVETNVVPSIVGGPDGRAFDAQLELPLYLSPERIPAFVEAAVLTAEDRHFRWHPGVNPVAMGRAAWTNFANWRHGGNARAVGASTITMQLAKNLMLSQQRSYDRKINEIVIALTIEALFTKSEILAMYLNTAYFGEGAYGIEVAARKYFGRSVGYEPRVNQFEAALLARTVKSPSTINPFVRRDVLDGRARALLRTMARDGYAVSTAAKARGQGSRRWAMRPFLFRDLAMRFMLPAGLKERSEPVVLGMTIDTEAQLYAEMRAVELLEAGKPLGYDSSAIVVLRRDAPSPRWPPATTMTAAT
jgi:penicillin-binding protein 1A